jgi:hypothetical protein
MHIILVSSRLTGAKSLTLTNRHLIVGLLLGALLVFSLTLGLFWVTVRHANEFKFPLLDSLVKSAQEAQQRKTEEFLRENLNAMAVKLGEMQAQLMRLDALGERLSPRASSPGNSASPSCRVAAARCPTCRRRICRWRNSTASWNSCRDRWKTGPTPWASWSRSCSTPRSRKS